MLQVQRAEIARERQVQRAAKRAEPLRRLSGSHASILAKALRAVAFSPISHVRPGLRRLTAPTARSTFGRLCRFRSQMEQLIHLAYASGASVPFSDAAVRALLTKARAVNGKLGVTGILLLVEGSFFQILEGAPQAVVPLYEKIGRDKRHQRVVKLFHEPTGRRDFQDWSMGLARLTSKDLATLPGFSDFFTHRTSFDDMGEGRARTLLAAFREGRFRTRVGE